jgi:L-lactate dehydrogenase complex protein LldG
VRSQFAEALAEAGGRCILIESASQLDSGLAELPVYREARKVASRVGPARGNVELASICDPHQLADVDVAIIPGELAVAENGAVWVTDPDFAHRALWFLAQHLILVVDGAQLVHTMHQAYQRLSLPRPGFGIFISGPSKTADIEQALVIGAHGPRSTTVFLIG